MRRPAYQEDEARLNLILPAVKWWSRWVPRPYELACRASALLVCQDPLEIDDLRFTIYDSAGCLGAALSEWSFGDSAAC
jgi:hypothetical protein